MKMIGLLITMLLISLLFIWWMDLTLSSTNKAMTTTQQIEGKENTQTQPGLGPIDYSKQEVERLNEMSEDRAKEINQLP